jgi:hypothetical protein
MAIRFLSEGYVAAANEALQRPDIVEMIGDLSLSVQFRVTDPPDAEEPIFYNLVFGGGGARMALGQIDDPDVRITSSYETTARLARQEIKDQVAFLTGKLKVAGNMARLMGNLGTFLEVRKALDALDVEY